LRTWGRDDKQNGEVGPDLKNLRPS
jgi:hypothetical protein